MTIRLGVLGFAHGHVNGYLQQWRMRPELGVCPVLGWDHDSARLKTAVETHGIEACTDLRQLLSNRDVEAVLIGSETAMHTELTEAAAAAGKAIILQKPMALNLTEADRITAAVEGHRVPFTLAWQMRVDPQNIEMKRLIQKGTLGKIFMVRRRHGLGLHLSHGFENSWHVNPAMNRDIWADDAAHPVDFIHWLLGLPESVTAEILTLGHPKIPMDNGVALFRYPGGPLAEVSCSFTCSGAENTTEIIGEKGTIIQNYGDVPSCNVPRPQDAPGLKWFLNETAQWTYGEASSPENHWQRIIGLAEPLAEFLHGRRGPIADAEAGRTSLKMLLACYLSVRQGRRVSLTDPEIAQV